MDKKWIYFIQLSNHCDDENGPGPDIFWFRDYKDSSKDPNNNIDYELWDKIVKRAGECGYTHLLIDIGDAIQYKSHPEIAAPDALSIEDFKKLLDKARSCGLTPLPKLNFSTIHHHWLKEYRRMVSSDIYRKVCVDLINEVCDIFETPELFHLGMDEEQSFDCASWGEIAVMRSPKLLFEDFGLMFDAVRKKGSRPWVWADYFWNHPDIFLENMPKDVVLSNWFYGRFRDYPKTDYHYNTLNAYSAFEEAGYDQIPTCSTYDNPFNPGETLMHIPTVVSQTHLMGYCMAPWILIESENEHLLLDSVERFYFARKDICPETLK